MTPLLSRVIVVLVRRDGIVTLTDAGCTSFVILTIGASCVALITVMFGGDEATVMFCSGVDTFTTGDGVVMFTTGEGVVTFTTGGSPFAMVIYTSGGFLLAMLSAMFAIDNAISLLDCARCNSRPTSSPLQ